MATIPMVPKFSSAMYRVKLSATSGEEGSSVSMLTNEHETNEITCLLMIVQIAVQST